jgi:hypothetical protein
MKHAFQRQIARAGAALLLTASVGAVAHAQGFPGGGGGGGGRRVPDAAGNDGKGQGLAEVPREPQELRGLQRTIFAIGEMDKDPKTQLTKPQAKSMLSVLGPWRNKPVMTNDQALQVNKQLTAGMSVAQIKKIATVEMPAASAGAAAAVAAARRRRWWRLRRPGRWRSWRRRGRLRRSGGGRPGGPGGGGPAAAARWPGRLHDARSAGIQPAQPRHDTLRARPPPGQAAHERADGEAAGARRLAPAGRFPQPTRRRRGLPPKGAPTPTPLFRAAPGATRKPDGRRTR